MEQKNRAKTFGVFPNIIDFMVMVFWVFFSQIIAVGACFLCGLAMPDEALAASADDQISLWAQISAAQSIAILYPLSMALSVAGILLYRRKRGARLKIKAWSIAGFEPTRLLVLFVLMVALQVAIEPITMLMPEVPEFVGRGFFTVLVTVICAPIFEELLCRGIVLESFRSKYGVWAGWLVSSLFFGIIHGQITTMFSASIIGLLLGYAYIRSNSIFSVIILHAMNNGLALVLMSFGLGDSTFRDVIPSDKLYWIVWGVSLLMVVVGFSIMLRRLHLVRRNEKLALKK